MAKNRQMRATDFKLLHMYLRGYVLYRNWEFIVKKMLIFHDSCLPSLLFHRIAHVEWQVQRMCPHYSLFPINKVPHATC